MKSLTQVLVIGLTLTLSAVAQEQTDKELTYALVGPVRAVRTEIANVIEKDGIYVEGPRLLSMSASFNEDGNRTELALYDDKGSLVRRIVSKFEGKKLVEFLNYDGAGNMWLRGVENYDAEGRTKERATYNGDGSLRSRTTFTRNARGQLIERTTYDAKQTLLEKNINTFNDQGQLNGIERRYYNTDGSLRKREVNTINPKEKGGEAVTFNGEGSIAGKTSWANENEITDYASDGALKKSTSLSTTGRLPTAVTYNADGTISKESQVPDVIDFHGNWTKQTKWVSNAQGTKVATVSYRIITYY
jgi:YD repeat-containing protein